MSTRTEIGPPTPEQREHAALAGRTAARAGRPVTDCPYSPTGPAPERVLAQVWVRSYRRVRPGSVDVSG